MTRHVLMMVLVLASGSLVAACGGGSQESEGPPPATENPVDPATASSVSGRVTFAGTPPTLPPLRMDSDPNCAQQGGTAPDESVVGGADGALENVFVYVKDGLGSLRFPVPSSAIVLDQKGCRYVPHVLGAQVGQTVEILNSDPTLHNIHAVPMSNREFNTGQPIRGMRHTHRFTAREVMVPFKCDVHPWMHAYIGVLDHPFFAVTSADGSFELQGLPPGTYTVEAWHERLGTQTQMVTIGAKETGTVAFSFKSTT
jgi:plastocyanin